MIVIALTDNTIDALLDSIRSIKHDVDVIELRLDFLKHVDLKKLAHLLSQVNYPVIFTLRPLEQGGHYQGDESSRIDLIGQLVKLKPAYFDLESSVDNATISLLSKTHPSVKIIRSYHHMAKTPDDLDALLEAMLHDCVSLYKVVTFAKSVLDNFRMLRFLKKHAPSVSLTAHCMGELSLPSRIIGAILGNHFHYAQLMNHPSPAPHCPDLHSLVNTYRIDTINRETKVFALLGDPVAHSVGHIFHNKHFSDLGINAVYIKMQLRQDQLTSFFHGIKGLPFEGFSITTPLKMSVMPFVDTCDPYSFKIASVNTLVKKHQRLLATNTDGLGALDAIENRRSIKNSHVLILGAGGAARAIAHAIALRNPASLSILNRNLTNAVALAKKTGASAYDYPSWHASKLHPMGIIVNTVPITDDGDKAIAEAIQPHLSSNMLYMGIDYSKPSPLLAEAVAASGCTMLSPMDLFTHQALRQIDYWFQK